MPARRGERDRAELVGHRLRDLRGRERDDEVRREVAFGVDDGTEAEPRQARDRRLDDRLVLSEMVADQVELPDLRQEHGARQFRHPKVQPEERPLRVLRSEAVGRVALIVDREESAVQLLIVGDDHAAVAAGDGLVLVEAVDAGRPDPADPLPLVRRTERLGAVLDERDAVAIGDVLELVEPRRRAEHVDDEDGLGPGRDARLHIGRIEVERVVDLGQDRDATGIDDGGDRGDERETGDDHLVAGPDADPEQRHEQAARPTAVQTQAVADAGERRRSPARPCGPWHRSSGRAHCRTG